MLSQGSLGNLFWLFIGLGIASLVLLSLAGFAGRLHHFLDICGQFRFQYSIGLFIFCALSFIGRQWLFGLFGVIFLLINLLLIFPLFLLPSGWRKGEKDCRLLLANVLKKNQSYSKLVNLVNACQPDFIALVEPNQSWIAALAPLDETYPYKVTSLREDNYGLALLSRYPLEGSTIQFLTQKNIPTITANVIINERCITLIVTHPPPPKNKLDLSFRDQQLEKLSKLVNPLLSSVVLCGDFNITPWSSAYRRLERRSNLIDTARGYGYQPTWPVDRPWLGIPIDQCLVSKDLIITNRKVESDIGSDHFPVIIDIRQKSRYHPNKIGGKNGKN